MKLLGLECSGKTASAAIAENGNLIAETTLNCGLTHSQTLLIMAENLLSQTQTEITELEGIAVSCGPGSFTGVRIGVALAKGLAMGTGMPCYGVSSLEALAWNTIGFAEDGPCIVCPSMDARRNQLYNALFEWREGCLCRLTEDRAISFEDLSDELCTNSRKILLLGDGAELAYTILKERNQVRLIPQKLRYGSAWGVLCATKGIQPVTPGKLMPTYLRLSQAEREYSNKNNGRKQDE